MDSAFPWDGGGLGRYNPSAESVTSALVVWPTSADSRNATASAGPAGGSTFTAARTITQALITSMFKPLPLPSAPRLDSSI